MALGTAKVGGSRAAAIAAGVFLVWRGMFARRGGGLVPLLAGILVLRQALAADRRGELRGASEGARRSPEVIEVKSPAELEPGIASASPEPTFPSRVARRNEEDAPPRRE